MRTMKLRFTRCSGPKLLALLPCLFLFSVAGRAQSPSTIFQLNGDSQNDGLTCVYAGPCDAWDNINLAGSSGTLRGHSKINSFILGTSNTDSFQGGGSKDPNPISQWSYSTSPTPNKDTLNAGYAAAYGISDFDIIFGADRLSPNGDANIGIWFFQSQITLGTASTCGVGNFCGSHANGDVFAISAFTGGGGTSTISVYEWNQPGLPNAVNGGCSSGVKSPSPGQCAAANLLLVGTSSTACSGSTPFCAVTNSGTVNASWASYSGGTIASPLFFEGGVDITQAFSNFGIPVPCFASFLEETRSSQSPSAVLKDFLLGSFPVCGVSISKACGTASVNPNGTAINYPVNGTVTNTGSGTLYNVEVCDTINGATTPDVVSIVNSNSSSQYYKSNTLGPGDSGTWSDTSTSSSATQGDSAIAVGSTNSGTEPTCGSSSVPPGPVASGTPATANCSLAPVTTLNVTKSCTTSLVAANNVVEVQVGYSGQVCNTGSSQVTGVQLQENDSSGPASTIASSIMLGPCEDPGTYTDPSTNQTYPVCNYSCTTPYDSTAGSCLAANTSCPSGHTCVAPNCANYSGSYIPATDTPVSDSNGNPGLGPGRYTFSDTVTVSNATATVGSLTKITGTSTVCDGTYGCGSATCPICQGPGECTQN